MLEKMKNQNSVKTAKSYRLAFGVKLLNYYSVHQNI